MLCLNLTLEMKNNSYDLRLHTFKHITGIVETCTQNDLKKKYNLKKTGISQLVNGHKNYDNSDRTSSGQTARHTGGRK
jgi:hypothetical protein